MAGIFGNSEGGSFFGGQYIYLVGDLSTVKEKIDNRLEEINFSLEHFKNKLTQIKKLLNKGIPTAVWGAGGKGSTFTNLLDPNKDKIKYVIDINPVKQNKFISVTAHPIYAPSVLVSDPVDQIILMNPNYKKEIENSLNNKNLKLITI